MREKGRKPRALRRVAVGGSACPRPMVVAFEKEFGIDLFHAWGMTETSPLGTIGTIKPASMHLTGEAFYDLKAKQGSAPFGVEMIITDDDDKKLVWNGKTSGRLKVRGPAISKGYYKDDKPAVDAEGYFDTGDVATIDADGIMHITDRAKDIIKSGGEWISSIEIENIATGHPDVAEAAVIGMHHPKWEERPLLVVVAAKGKEPKRDEILSYLSDKIAKWWIPDDVQIVDEIPHTASGKINKLGLRKQFADYRLPS